MSVFRPEVYFRWYCTIIPRLGVGGMGGFEFSTGIQSNSSFPEELWSWDGERWAEHGLSLPMFPGMTGEQVDRVCRLLHDMKLQPAEVG